MIKDLERETATIYSKMTYKALKKTLKKESPRWVLSVTLYEAYSKGDVDLDRSLANIKDTN